MRSRSILVPRGTQAVRARFTPPAGLSHRYMAFGLLLVLASCTATNPPSRFAVGPAPMALRCFQIQIYTTQERANAELTAVSARDWWDHLDVNQQRILFGVKELPVQIKWRDPYYRVRIGQFTSREEARAVLGMVSREFPAAFIVADTML